MTAEDKMQNETDACALVRLRQLHGELRREFPSLPPGRERMVICFLSDEPGGTAPYNVVKSRIINMRNDAKWEGGNSSVQDMINDEYLEYCDVEESATQSHVRLGVRGHNSLRLARIKRQIARAPDEPDMGHLKVFLKALDGIEA